MMHTQRDGFTIGNKPHVAIAIADVLLRAQIAGEATPYYNVAEYGDIAATLAGCRARTPALALIGERLPISGGFDLVRMLRLDPGLASIPVFMVIENDDEATRREVMRSGADGYVATPFPPGALLAAVSKGVNLAVERAWRTLDPLQEKSLTNTLQLFNRVTDLISNGQPIPPKAVADACRPLVEVVASNGYKSMLDAIKNHDNYSFVHSMRVATFLSLFGFHLGLPQDEQLILASGGLLHDIGKMTIPHAVLNKPGRLGAAELATMRGHVTNSIDYLRKCEDMPKSIITIAAQHHERLDGTGYPFGLSGGQLNRLARMASIIDVFSALTDRRVYKPSLSPEAALRIMLDEMGSHLDMKLLRLLREMLLDAATPAT